MFLSPDLIDWFRSTFYCTLIPILCLVFVSPKCYLVTRLCNLILFYLFRSQLWWVLGGCCLTCGHVGCTVGSNSGVSAQRRSNESQHLQSVAWKSGGKPTKPAQTLCNEGLCTKRYEQALHDSTVLGLTVCLLNVLI